MKIYGMVLATIVATVVGVTESAALDSQELEERIQRGAKEKRVQAIRGLVDDNDISNEAKITVLLSSLAEEILKPASGKLIAKGYVSQEEFFKRQYMYSLVDVAKNELPTIEKHLDAVKQDRFLNKSKEFIEWSERSSLILGLLGKRKALPSIRRLLTESQSGNIRQTAAHVIKITGDKRAIPQLIIALSDPIGYPIKQVFMYQV